MSFYLSDFPQIPGQVRRVAEIPVICTVLLFVLLLYGCLSLFLHACFHHHALKKIGRSRQRLFFDIIVFTKRNVIGLCCVIDFKRLEIVFFPTSWGRVLGNCEGSSCGVYSPHCHVAFTSLLSAATARVNGTGGV